MNKSIIYFANIAYELGKWAFVIILIGTLSHFFLITLFVISGPSMEVNFHNEQIVAVSRIGLFTGAYKRGDPMVIKFPGDPEHKKYIKRLIGLPGEHVVIKNNQVFINDKPLPEPYIKFVGEEAPWYEKPEWEVEAKKLHAQGKALTKPDVDVTLGKDDYFLLGDNRENSNDSRKWFSASKSDMIGPVRFILGQIATDPECIGYCMPSFTFKDWGPTVNPYY